MKAVIRPLEDYAAIPPELMELAREMAENAHCPMAETLRLMLPAQMRGGRIRVKTVRTAQLAVTEEEARSAIAMETRSGKRRELLELLLDGKKWTVIVPSEPGPQLWGTGGEIAVWKTSNAGKKWKKTAMLTSDSPYNHGYVRRPYGGTDPFFCYWADGNPDRITPSRIYFSDSKGNIFVLPYDMTEEWQAPTPYKQK